MVTLASQYRGTITLSFRVSATGTETITAALRQVTDATRASLIQAQLGLSQTALIIEGRLEAPRRAPDTLKAGRKAALTWAGRDGIATLQPGGQPIPDAWRDRYGDKLLLSWEAPT